MFLGYYLDNESIALIIIIKAVATIRNFKRDLWVTSLFFYKYVLDA